MHICPVTQRRSCPSGRVDNRSRLLADPAWFESRWACRQDRGEPKSAVDFSRDKNSFWAGKAMQYEMYSPFRIFTQSYE
ncbi:unnamed protein product [Protopolystoma xenopodis]|uniref:Uncharacterized protein n=1 Tax=Protopolystoma xenopodis TaxID=117903 RepID=A0A448X447_9PLAT|nr:unnamed protein product [Protopolystoma xenopodis]